MKLTKREKRQVWLAIILPLLIAAGTIFFTVKSWAAFTVNWDETKPAGTEPLSQGDDRAREHKKAIRERLAIDHAFDSSDLTTTDTIGFHKWVTFLEQGTDPDTKANAVRMYVKDVSGLSVLYYKPSSATAGMAIGGQYYSLKVSTSTDTINWNSGNVQRLALATGANTVVFQNPGDGGRYLLECVQPDTPYTAATVTWPATVAWSGGTAPTLTATMNKVDIIGFIYDATANKYYASISYNY